MPARPWQRSPDGPRGAALAANRWRNARGDRARTRRWASVREACWAVLDPLVAPGARVAVVGAGNGDTTPLRELAARASLTLIDVDAAALRRSGRRARGCETVVHDITEGEADAAISRDTDRAAQRRPIRVSRVPGAPYDLILGDLFYSQLLYPALLDAGVDAKRRLQRDGPRLTRHVVARLHASADTVVHVHDAVGWWDGHPQPYPLDAVLGDPRLADRCTGPAEADPRVALRALGVPIRATHHWRWPFTGGVDYLAVGTVAGR